ncbi:MAG TPA: S-adenosylmethionine decarboxylase [Actinomycetota bacterium]|nr:S-adenosylmethionine decarboxylase [Actinomycetota bacterium]
MKPDATEAPQEASGSGDIHTYAVDLWVEDEALLCDAPALKSMLEEAAAAGGATVLGGDAHVFPNGAVTVFLILAQSHLSLHTWPEYHLANVDLFSYGPIRGDSVVEVVKKTLDARDVNLVRLLRSVRR